MFEVQGSVRYGSGGSLYVRLAPGAPAAMREAMFTRPLAATCAVPGQHVREFAGRWDVEVHQFGTALLTDDPSVVIANVATRCALWVGREGARPDTAYFDGPPFGRADAVARTNRLSRDRWSLTERVRVNVCKTAGTATAQLPFRICNFDTPDFRRVALHRSGVRGVSVG